MAEPEDEELPPLAVGTVLEDRFRITGELGVGGIGAVYRAEHLRLGHEVAIKALRSAYAGHATMRPRFEREAKALAALKHPHIVAINDYSVADGTPYLVMELLEGCTLEDLLEKGPLDEAVAREIALEILEALIYAHEEGFVHRDLKPANVFLCELPTNPHFVKILDFGFVKLVMDGPESNGPLTHSGIAFGTPSYMSPEQATGDTTDARTDLYAFGVILYEMLAGRRPFVGTMPEIVRQQLVEPLPPLSAGGRGILASQELRELLEKATAKDRADRFASADELREALLALPTPWVEARPGGEDDTLPPPPGERATSQPTVRVGRSSGDAEPAPPPPPPRRSRAPIVVGLLIGVVALGSVAAWLALRDPSPDARAALSTATPPPDAPDRPVADEPVADEPVADEPVAPPPVEPAPVDEPIAEAPDMDLLGDPVAEAGPVLEPLPPDPWETLPPSSYLDGARRRVQSGRALTRNAKRQVRRFVAADRADPRPHLLFAQSYVVERQPLAALERYDLAMRVDPGARGDPQMIDDLIALAAEGEQMVRATAMLARIYEGHAIPLVEARLADAALTDERRASLELLRERILAGPPPEPPPPTPAASRRSTRRRSGRATRRRRRR